MTRARDLEDRIGAVARLRGAPASDPGRALVRAALSAKAGRLAARGAEVAGAWEEPALVPDLVRAFERFLGLSEAAAAKADPGCGAKTALVDALGRIGEEPPEGTVPERVFLPGAGHVQWESVWGGRVDTAGALRAACGAGLVAWPHPDALVVLADHLADPQADVRRGRGAQRGATRSGGRRAPAAPAPQAGRRGCARDRRVRRALLALAPAASLPLVTAFLEAEDDALFGEAALALGESRLSGACDALCAAWQRTFARERRRVLLAALGALRREEALAFLLRRIEEEAPDLACDALEALSAYGGEATLRVRVQAAVARTDDDTLSRCFDATFGTGCESDVGGQPPHGAE